jgi:3-phenylpropionate/trans-cinnamate dioxygenase ferredoxin reductase component
MHSTILVIGAGHAGVQAVDTLRKEGFTGRLVLVSDEAHLPYQRPPLSKAFLSREKDLTGILLRHASYYPGHDVELKLNVRALNIDSRARSVLLSDGAVITYDRLLLCTGSNSRALSCLGSGHRGVHYLRTVRDAEAILGAIQPTTRVAIAGGGYIGLEAAATLRELGCETVVLEMADRIMNRVVSPAVSAFFYELHRSRGVRVICNTLVERIEGGERVERVICADGSTYEANLLMVGVGSLPNVELALNAGLHCENGIVVDQHCRTSENAIFAAGDCTNFPSQRFGFRVRLESVDNAFEQATVAALNMLNRDATYDRVPWFWSDQFDDKLLIIGMKQGFDQLIVRGNPADRKFSVCYLRDRELLAVEAVNNAKDYMAARKLIAERTKMNANKLANPEISLKECA